MNTRQGLSQCVFVALCWRRRCVSETFGVWAARSTPNSRGAQRRVALLMRRHFRRNSLLLLTAGVLISGCGAQQRAAENLIDPRLRREGVLVEHQADARELALGPYRVEQLQLEDEPFDGSGPLAPDASGRTRPTQQLDLKFSLVGGATTWIVECVGQRRQPPDHDLAAVADELRDEVAVHCQLAGGEQRWVLKIHGRLAANMLGQLDPVGTDAGGKVVEIIMWHQLWSISRRHLPASLAVIRGDAGTEAALILDTPERAWLAPELDDSARELALASLLALRLMPLGFDG